jgi:glc operon protein GlcG
MNVLVRQPGSAVRSDQIAQATAPALTQQQVGAAVAAGSLRPLPALTSASASTPRVGSMLQGTQGFVPQVEQAQPALTGALRQLDDALPPAARVQRALAQMSPAQKTVVANTALLLLKQHQDGRLTRDELRFALQQLLQRGPHIVVQPRAPAGGSLQSPRLNMKLPVQEPPSPRLPEALPPRLPQPLQPSLTRAGQKPSQATASPTSALPAEVQKELDALKLDPSRTMQFWDPNDPIQTLMQNIAHASAEDLEAILGELAEHAPQFLKWLMQQSWFVKALADRIASFSPAQQQGLAQTLARIDVKRDAAEALGSALRDAEAVARAANWPVAIVMVDAEGRVIARAGVDDPQRGSIEIAAKKAITALRLQGDSAQLQQSFYETIDRNASNAIDNMLGDMRRRGIVPMEGGVLLRRSDGTIVGAVGVSGVHSSQDALVAQTAAAALAGLPLSQRPVLPSSSERTQPRYGAALKNDAAVDLINALREEVQCTSPGLSLAAVIVDNNGAVLQQVRFNHADERVLQAAAEKAQTANGFRRSTSGFAQKPGALNKETFRFRAVAGMATEPGGEPIFNQRGEVVGAIGVSASNAEMAQRLARFAAASCAQSNAQPLARRDLLDPAQQDRINPGWRDDRGRLLNCRECVLAFDDWAQGGPLVPAASSRRGDASMGPFMQSTARASRTPPIWQRYWRASSRRAMVRWASSGSTSAMTSRTTSTWPTSAARSI